MKYPVPILFQTVIYRGGVSTRLPSSKYQLLTELLRSKVICSRLPTSVGWAIGEDQMEVEGHTLSAPDPSTHRTASPSCSDRPFRGSVIPDAAWMVGRYVDSGAFGGCAWCGMRRMMLDNVLHVDEAAMSALGASTGDCSSQRGPP